MGLNGIFIGFSWDIHGSSMGFGCDFGIFMGY
jgi:hypothetical protein